MKRVTSFKAQYRPAPARSSTPPRPVLEPLSPVLRPTAPSAAHPAGDDHNAIARISERANGGASGATATAEGGRAPLPLGSPAVMYGSPLPAGPLPLSLPSYSVPLGTPSEALTDTAMASLHTSPVHVEMARHASHPSTSSATAPYPTSGHAPKHTFVAYPYSERPAKRARSEYQTSPPQGPHQSRPATSHIPGYSYNVEQAMDSGMRMYQQSRASAPQQAVGGDKMLSDAELLLFFSNVSAHTAQTPPSTAKRWSISQPSPMELPAQQTQQADELYGDPALPSSPNQHVQLSPDFKHIPEPPAHPLDVAEVAPESQTHTPPEEAASAITQPPMQEAAPAEERKTKKHQGWPKGKPRGPRSTPTTGKRKRSTPKPKSASTSTSTAPDQLHSPQSLPADHPTAMALDLSNGASQPVGLREASPRHRRHSFSTSFSQLASDDTTTASLRARSVPLGAALPTTAATEQSRPPVKKPTIAQPDLICAACKSSDSAVKVGDGEQWIGCDGCKEWYHYACAGFSSEREVRDVNKFYCGPCRPKFGETTKVRKSVRVHATVDYAGLNEGVLKTSDDNPEHHYIAAFKNGDIEFTPETFARMPPEFITADFLGKMNGFKEPIMIPAALNPRTHLCTEDDSAPQAATLPDQEDTAPDAQFEYETVVDDGQDRLGMVIPHGLTVRRVAELYGPNETVPVIDVKAQEGEGKKWTMSKWADYYEQQGEKPVRNVISLEVSRSRLGKLIRRPKAVRDMDLQDSVWREDDKFAPPPVQFYCLMSVADCFTDFHIDFGGSSVYYHIVKGRKVFFMIPPTKQNLKKYEDWCLSPNQGHDWLGKQVKGCYRVDLYPGDTMLIPSGWIHAVWTPEDSLVIGGNFLTRVHYGMQIKVLEIEKNTKVALLFRYPFFQKIMWLTVIKYLEEDPVPESVQRLLQSGEQFSRAVPIYCEPDKFGHNSHLGPTNYNRRYYSKHELEGVTDLLNYIWRTVLISLDKIDLPQKTRNAVTKSIPKGHGDPLVVAKRFAMWIAWKRGNENIPSWAFPDASLPEIAEAGEKKLSAAQVRKMERETLNEVLRGTAERSSARIRASDTLPPHPNPTFSMSNPVPPATNITPSLSSSTPLMRDPTPSQSNPVPPVEYSLPSNGKLSPTNDERSPSFHDPTPPIGVEDLLHFDMTPVSSGPMTGFLRPGAGNPHITTPKTSQLGPKRVACDACRKRRIRCKHKDELIDTSKPGMHTIDLSGSYGISVKRRLSDHSITDGQSSAINGSLNGGPIMADVNGDPYALKSGRVKACADCRKSKRRCIHDEYGNVDPIKANEVPIPRGSATKKRRVSDEDSTISNKRFKHESSYDDEYTNGDMHSRHSLPNQFGVGSSLLQDIAFSAQQALDRGEDDNLVPVDPALQAYANRAFSAMDMAPTYATNGDSIISSIEQQAEGDMPVDDLNFSGPNRGAHGPSIEPLTPGPPGPPPHNDTIHVEKNGYPVSDTIHVQINGFASRQPPQSNAVRHPSSPVSPRQMSTMSPGAQNYDAYMTSPSVNNHNNYNHFTTNSDFPPPLTPTAHPQPSSRSYAKPNQTPSRSRSSRTPKSTPNGRRRDSKDSIKLEAGFGAGMGMGMDMLDLDMIDPSLDQASIELIKQLQKEEHGLRRRSRD